MTTKEFVDFPFTHKGINFVSRITEDSPFLNQISNIPPAIFESMNRMCLDEYLTKKTYTLSEIQTVLDTLNEGGSHAFILLGENN